VKYIHLLAGGRFSLIDYQAPAQGLNFCVTYILHKRSSAHTLSTLLSTLTPKSLILFTGPLGPEPTELGQGKHSFAPTRPYPRNFGFGTTDSLTLQIFQYRQDLIPSGSAGYGVSEKLICAVWQKRGVGG